ncbi:MAG: DUF885 family protein [Polyangia bacterium]
MDRRQFLVSGTAAALVGLLSRAHASDAKLRAALDRIAYGVLARSPETLTSLGLDKGTYAWARARLDDGPAVMHRHVGSDVAKYRGLLAGVHRAALDERDQVLLDSVLYCLDSGSNGARYAFGAVDAFGGARPYIVSQQGGAYHDTPEFLNAQHPVDNVSDAEAYLARVRALGTALDEETAQLEHDVAMGVVPPDFILDTTLKQQKALRAVAAADSGLVQSLARRAKAKSIAGDWAGRATKLVTSVVYPALDRQLAALAKARAKATHDAGVWKLPDGEAYYGWRLRDSTSTTMTPQQIHQLGLEQGAALDSRMDEVLRKQGFTQGTVGARLAALSKDPKQLFADTDAGKVEAVAYVQQKMDALRALLPRVSRMQLHASVTVKRVPADIEAGAPLGYMNPAALDGSRPAIYYINLASTSGWPRFSIPSLSAHEGLPGHTWQFAYIAEHRSEVPLITSTMSFNAFVEGWALYAEQLVDELGFYDDDPLGRLGMYQAMRFRASRLVTDTGLHAMRWTREKAIDYLQTSTGRPTAAVTSEVDRYCASPGQACGYKVGHTEIVRLRDRAKAALGAKFDVRDFDDVVVQTGGVPLTLLATVVDAYIAKKR